ncbi:IscS subfamily cysteine desulfurase [Radiobacillus sp. PE A8.2]|uniref:IscS subfamily cysteine desulfurase n=1 Tax=Radiobacillus sp. PE A8.2 TaxID=3380349 RepID=UPI00388EF31D
MIYLDYAATTPVSDHALQVYNEVSKNMYGNPSSLHDIGSRAKQLLEHARQELALLLHADASGIYFTSGGTESNVLAIDAILRGNQKNGKHVITTRMEHASLQSYFQQITKQGYQVSYVAVNEHGEIDINHLATLIRDTTVLVSIHHVNSEIGVIQPINEIAELVHTYGALFHSDCVQSFGKLPINMKESKIDSISISSHKIYGPMGVGAVYLNPSVAWESTSTSLNQENGFRAGTVNVPGIAAFVTAAQASCIAMEQELTKISSLRERFINLLDDGGFAGHVFTSKNGQLPHIIGILLDGLQGDYAMLEFNRADIAISTGSACSVGQQQPSKTMLAVGKTDVEAKRFIRLSLGKQTTVADITKAATICLQLSASMTGRGATHG